MVQLLWLILTITLKIINMQFNPLHFTDQAGTEIQLGDKVTATKGKNKGATCIFLFCIPQHRFGFMYLKFYEKMMENNNQNLYGYNMFPEEFVTVDSNLQFYYTPKSQKEIIKL
jgi:hypothetical protein